MADNHVVKEGDGTTVSTFRSKDTSGIKTSFQVPSTPNGTAAIADGETLPNAVIIGALNESSPSTDTASSGLNGRLQRIAQRLTSLLGLLPNSIGQKNKAGSLSVTFPSDADPISVIQSGSWTVQRTPQLATIDFTIASGSSVSDTVDIGAGYTLIGLVIPNAWTAADIVFNTHPIASGSVVKKTTTTGGTYLLANVPTTGGCFYQIPVTDFLGNRFIQMVSVSGGTPVNQSATRTIKALIGIL